MKDTIARGILIASVLVAALGGAPASQATVRLQAASEQTTEYKYVAAQFGSDLFDIFDRDTPVGHFAPGGYFDVTPSGTSFTINIDDFGTADGLDVRVSVYTRGGENIFGGCVPVRSTTTITGATADQPARIVIWAYGSNCGALLPDAIGATAGVATLGGVK